MVVPYYRTGAVASVKRQRIDATGYAWSSRTRVEHNDEELQRLAAGADPSRVIWRTKVSAGYRFSSERV